MRNNVVVMIAVNSRPTGRTARSKGKIGPKVPSGCSANSFLPAIGRGVIVVSCVGILLGVTIACVSVARPDTLVGIKRGADDWLVT